LGAGWGNGRQYVSWIHDDDFIRAIYWLITRENFEGVVILASPNPLPNAEFMRVLRKAWGTRVGLPAAKCMLEIATFFLRTETELVLKSRRVIPSRLLHDGFEFKFPKWKEAARELCRRWRGM
jgi:NAD dependent epimerase/dehydratase family enzyme